jgi:hypothetical protein
MMQTVAVLTSLIAIVPAVPLQGAAQLSAGVDAPRELSVSAADSVRTVRAARRAQEQFESLRRANLPFRPGAPRGACDLRVGRLCYWHDDGEPSAEVPEPDRIARGRERLVTTLSAASRMIKGDEWLAGQRVRYLVEARRDSAAVAAARQCESSPWWCAALTGLALHRAGDYGAADSAFVEALASMAEMQRCKWTDISLFLEGESAKRYRRLPCSERAGVERRFWWLSQPRYGLGGNDARTEFFARRTMSRLEQQARSGDNMSWGADAEEILMRFGWPTWWSRDHPSSIGASPSPVIVGHGATPSFFFHPSDRLLTSQPAEARPEDWDLKTKRPVARYAPAYAAGLSDLRTQVAVFRRGDSALVVASYEHPRDTLFDGGEIEATLAVARDESSPATVVRQTRTGRDPTPLVVNARADAMLVSLELAAPRRRGFARARFGVRLDDASSGGRLALSKVLLYSPDAAAGASLDDVAPHALGAPRAVAGSRVGVYWEIYGIRPAGEPLVVTLTVERVGVGWHMKAAERLGLASKVTPLRVRWHEVPKRDAGFASRAITVDLSTLPAGRYRIHLTVVAEDGSTASSERLLELLPAP